MKGSGQGPLSSIIVVVVYPWIRLTAATAAAVAYGGVIVVVVSAMVVVAVVITHTATVVGRHGNLVPQLPFGQEHGLVWVDDVGGWWPSGQSVGRVATTWRNTYMRRREG